MNPLLARASGIANEVLIQEALIKQQGANEYTINYLTGDGQSNTHEISLLNTTTATRRFPYPPLSYDAPIVTIKFTDFQGALKSIDVACINWSMYIETIRSNKIIGWARKRESFCIRPFLIKLNDKSFSYEAYATGARDDVTRQNINDGHTGISIEIILSGMIAEKEANIEFGYSFESDEKWQPFFCCTKSVEIHSESFLNYLGGSPSEPAKQLSKTRDTTKGNRSIAVLMPIYDGYNETLHAIDSFSQYFHQSKSGLNIRFLLGLDNPANDHLNQEIKNRYESNELFTILTNHQNLGFIGNCNRLFSEVHPDEDILLVNSDIIAPRGNWIERLIQYLDIDESIGTVTPLSNQASIYSFPIPNQEQGTMGSLSIDQIDELLAKTAVEDIPYLIETPSCHGFCTLIAHSRLKLDYLFDVEFGRGYGEENDLSCRVKNAGMLNIAAPNIYVYHHESISFSSNKQSLLEKNLRTLGEKYPHYHDHVAAYCETDPLRQFRNNAVLQYFSQQTNSENSVLHISHFRGGGTDKYIREIVSSDPSVSHFALKPHRSLKGYVEFFHLSTRDFEKEHPSLITLSEGEFSNCAHNILSSCGIKQVILHSLIDFLPHGDLYSIWEPILDTPSLRIVVHDYHWINPEQNLLNSRGTYTVASWDQSVFDIDKIRRQEQASRLVFISENLRQRTLTFEHFFQRANKVVFPSESAFKILSRSMSTRTINSSVIEHDDSDSVARSWLPTEYESHISNDQDLNISIIGAIGENKGYDLLLALAVHICENNLPLRLVVVGWTMDDIKLQNSGNVLITGRYEEKDFPAIIKNNDLHCSLFLSQWPETYSYTLSLSFYHQLYPFVLDYGAQAERVRKTGFGLILDNSSPSYISSRLLEYRRELISRAKH